VGGAALVSLAAGAQISVNLIVALVNESGAATAALPCPHLLLMEGVPAISVGAAGALVAEVKFVVVAAHVWYRVPIFVSLRTKEVVVGDLTREFVERLEFLFFSRWGLLD